MTESWQKEHHWLQHLPLLHRQYRVWWLPGRTTTSLPSTDWGQCRRIAGSERHWGGGYCWWQLHRAEILLHKGAHGQAKWFTVRPYLDMARCNAVDHCQLYRVTWCTHLWDIRNHLPDHTVSRPHYTFLEPLKLKIRSKRLTFRTPACKCLRYAKGKVNTNEYWGYQASTAL